MKRYAYRTSFTFDGKRYVVYAESEPELIEKKTNKLRDLQDGKVTIGENMPLKKWAEMALDTYKPGITQRTKDCIKYRWEKHIYPAIGSMPIRSVRPMHCQKILNSVEDSSHDLITKLSQELKFIFRTAVDNKIILENPAERLTKPKGTKRTHRALTAAEKKHFLAVCENTDKFRLFELMYYCGCRPAEAMKCIGKDIDHDQKRLHIRGTKTANADRYVPIPEVFYAKVKNVPPFAFIAPNRQNGAHTDGTYKRLRTALRRAMNISMGAKTYKNALVPPLPLAEDFTPYCLRHTYCTELCKSAVDVRTAQKLMGHASIEITADIYTHIDDSQIDDAARKINLYHAAMAMDRESKK